MKFDSDFRNQLLFGVCYLFLLTPFSTGIAIQEIAANSVNEEFSDIWNGYKWNSYNSLAMFASLTSISCWLMPSIISLIGVKPSMVLGATAICSAFAVFLYPLKYGLILSGLILGFLAPILWISQGNYLALTSDSKTISHNTGMLWCIANLSFVIGNLIIAYMFEGKEHINTETRIISYSVLIGFGIVGILGVYLLKRPGPSETQVSEKPTSPAKAFVNAMKLLKTRKMQLFCLTSIFTGLELSFLQGLYTASISYTRNFGVNRKKYASECGLFIGVGEVVAGLTFMLTANRKKPQVVTAVGYGLCIITYCCVFINLPFQSTIYETDEKAIITSNLPLALLCGFLLGLVDGIYETQIYEFIATNYKENSSAPFAIFASLQGLGNGFMFFISNYIRLNVHITILILGATIGTGAFFLAGRIDPPDEMIKSIEFYKPRVSVASQTDFELKPSS